MADEAGTRTRRRRCTALTLAVALLAPSAASADRLRTIDVTTGASQVLASSPNLEWLHRPCWAPDGRIVALEYRSTRWSLQRRYVAYGPTGGRTILGRASRFTTEAAFAPGCARVAERRRRTPLADAMTLVREPSGAPLAPLPAFAGALGWTADGALLATADVAAGAPWLRLVDAATGAPAAEVALHAMATRAGDVAPSPAGDRFAVVLGERLHLFGRDGSALGIVAPAARVASAAWSPDGTRMAFTTRRRTGVSHYVADAAPGAHHRRLLTTRALATTPLAWSPDGTHLVAGGG